MEDPCCMLISPNFLEAILVQEKKKEYKSSWHFAWVDFFWNGLQYGVTCYFVDLFRITRTISFGYCLQNGTKMSIFYMDFFFLLYIRFFRCERFCWSYLGSSCALCRCSSWASFAPDQFLNKHTHSCACWS